MWHNQGMGSGGAQKRRGRKLAELNALAAAGRPGVARLQLRAMNFDKLPRKDRVHWARLARRVVLPDVAARALEKLVLERGGGATPEETAEYAAALSALGANAQARRLLRGVSTEQCPDAALFRANLEFRCWDWAAATRNLREFLGQPSVQGVKRCIGKLNLGGALTGEVSMGADLRLLAEAETLLLESREEASALGVPGLTGVIDLFLAQKDFFRGDHSPDPFRSLVNRHPAGDPLGERAAVWALIAEVHGLNDRRRALREARRASTRYRQLGKGTFARDLEFAVARVTLDAETLRRLYVGSPFLAMRRVLGQLMGEPPPTYLWKNGSAPRRQLDLVDLSPTMLKRGQAVHRMLLALAADFYAPQPLGELHERMNPGESYLLDSGPNRVHQVVHRVRTALKARGFRSRVDASADGIQLVLSEGEGLRLPWPAAHTVGAEQARTWKDDRWEEQWRRLWSARGAASEITANQAARLLGCSRRSAIRILDEALLKARASRLGRGPATRYRLIGR
ncbi:MAG: hypothetical protein IT285_10390 [Bdellovibrionales bacterium]|nr:hypothetical protein [Bdellovibrionales bacterium]